MATVHHNSIALWDSQSGKILHEFKEPASTPAMNLRQIALTPDGKQLIHSHADSSLHLVDVASGKELRAIEMPAARPGFHPSFRLQKLAVSPDGLYLAFGGPAIPLTVCELATGKRLRELPQPQGILSGLAFSPNGRFLAADEYTRVRLFGVQSGKEMRNLPMKPGTSNALAFSPDGRTLATCRAANGNNGGFSINLWDLAAERQQHPPIGHEGTIQSLVFFPDGKRLVSSDINRSVILWDISSGNDVAQRTNTTPLMRLSVTTPLMRLSVAEDGERVFASSVPIMRSIAGIRAATAWSVNRSLSAWPRMSWPCLPMVEVRQS